MKSNKFRYLTSLVRGTEDVERTERNCIELAYMNKEYKIRKKIIIRDSNLYYYVLNYNFFEEGSISSITNMNEFHEIFYNPECRIFFDIDCNDVSLLNPFGIFGEKDLIVFLVAIIIDKMKSVYHRIITFDDILIFSSSLDKKVSLHMLVCPLKFYVSNIFQARMFAQIIKYHVEHEEIAALIDDQVYSRNKSLRLYNSTKNGKRRKAYFSGNFRNL